MMQTLSQSFTIIENWGAQPPACKPDLAHALCDLVCRASHESRNLEAGEWWHCPWGTLSPVYWIQCSIPACRAGPPEAHTSVCWGWEEVVLDPNPGAQGVGREWCQITGSNPSTQGRKGVEHGHRAQSSPQMVPVSLIWPTGPDS